MKPQLQVIHTPPEQAVEPFSPRPFDLTVHPTRPGVAHEPLMVILTPEVQLAVGRASAEEGMPAEAWAALAIESERSLTLASQLTGISAGELAGVLHAAARAPGCARIPRGLGGRLAGYARALRHAVPIQAPRLARQTLTLPVPYLSIVAWQQAASTTEQGVGEWASDRLGTMPAGRVSWEAAAAESGQTHCEWVLAHAARRCSCSSAVAHPAG